MSLRSSLASDTSPASAVPPSAQKACATKGSSVRLSPGSSRDAVAGAEIETLDVLEDAEAVLGRRARRVDLNKLDDEARAAAVDDVFGLDDVVVVRRALAVVAMIAFSA